MSGTCFEPCDEIVDSHPRAFTARDVEHDVPVGHHQCAVAELKCLMHVVRDHQAGDVTFRHDAAGEVEHLFRRCGVERRGVLVKK